MFPREPVGCASPSELFSEESNSPDSCLRDCTRPLPPLRQDRSSLPPSWVYLRNRSLNLRLPAGPSPRRSGEGFPSRRREAYVRRPCIHSIRKRPSCSYRGLWLPPLRPPWHFLGPTA